MATTGFESASEKSLLNRRNGGWSKKRKLIIGGVAGVVVALGVGLGVGLGLGLNRGGDDNDDNSGNTSPTSTPVPPITNGSSSIWQPAAGTTWNYQLYGALDSTTTNGIQVWGIDLFDNNVTMINGLQTNGARVICYFSAGSYEDWRADKGAFASSDLGKTLDGWPHERWLNVSSPNVRNIMLARLDVAVTKNCNGVDPDNVDGYDNDNGLGLTQADAVDYMTFLAEAASQRNLSIGLKNAGGILPQVINLMQWSVNEQCEQYNECDTYAPFIQQNKPVFHVEYPKGDTDNDDAVSATVKANICNNSAASGFSTIIKNKLLDEWIETC